MNNIEGSVSKSSSNITGALNVSIAATPDIQVGTTTTLESGSKAYVNLDPSSTKMKPIFNFGIPRGPAGPGGGPGGSGTSNYEELTNKPSINNTELDGNKTLDDLGIQPKGDYASKKDIPDTSSFVTKEVSNLSNYYDKTSIDEMIGDIE